MVDPDCKVADIYGVYVLQANGQLFIKLGARRMDGAHVVTSDKPNVRTVDVLEGSCRCGFVGGWCMDVMAAGSDVWCLEAMEGVMSQVDGQAAQVEAAVAVAAEEAEKNLIKVKPAKRFFVEMLTRDIDLEGAILDLLDNCIDGALRTNKTNPPDNFDPALPYRGYWAKITLSPDKFVIHDNCGGIDKDTARNSAFKFGREDAMRDEGVATVGLYGIGMKRAIFKLGGSAVVKTRHQENEYHVAFTNDWINDPDVWDLKLEEPAAADLECDGTWLEIGDLKPNIKIEFDPEKNSYENRLIKAIHDTYSFLIKKGFSVKVNEKDIALKLNTLVVTDGDFSESGIAPYVYNVSHQGVDVRLVMGMYSKLPDFTEDEVVDDEAPYGAEEASFLERSKHNAGWTVICNDRVILANDTTEKTGWALAPHTPNFHTQYAAIGGYVIFTSHDPKNLPLTTTKREIDQGSVLYMHIKEEMKSAIKTMVGFTNKWKSPSSARDEMQENVRSVDVLSVAALIPDVKFKEVNSSIGGKRFKPTLPAPPKNHEPKKIRVSFSKTKAEIASVKEYLFGEEDKTPNEVGEQCFDICLSKAK